MSQKEINVPMEAASFQVERSVENETNLNQTVPHISQPTVTSRNIPSKTFSSTTGRGTRLSSRTLQSGIGGVGRRDQPLRRSKDASTFIKFGNDFKESTEYKEFALEYEKQVEGYQKESSRIAEQLMNRMQKLEEYANRFKDTNTNTLLLRNRLSHDIKSISNDLKEAYNHILVLINERGNMKKQFCHYNAKIKDLNKTKQNLQEELAL
jgi:hypothetical protein